MSQSTGLEAIIDASQGLYQRGTEVIGQGLTLMAAAPIFLTLNADSAKAQWWNPFEWDCADYREAYQEKNISPGGIRLRIEDDGQVTTIPDHGWLPPRPTEAIEAHVEEGDHVSIQFKNDEYTEDLGQYLKADFLLDKFTGPRPRRGGRHVDGVMYDAFEEEQRGNLLSSQRVKELDFSITRGNPFYTGKDARLLPIADTDIDDKVVGHAVVETTRETDKECLAATLQEFAFKEIERTETQPEPDPDREPDKGDNMQPCELVLNRDCPGEKEPDKGGSPEKPKVETSQSSSSVYIPDKVWAAVKPGNLGVNPFNVPDPTGRLLQFELGVEDSGEDYRYRVAGTVAKWNRDDGRSENLFKGVAEAMAYPIGMLNAEHLRLGLFGDISYFDANANNTVRSPGGISYRSQDIESNLQGGGGPALEIGDLGESLEDYLTVFGKVAVEQHRETVDTGNAFDGFFGNVETLTTESYQVGGGARLRFEGEGWDVTARGSYYQQFGSQEANNGEIRKTVTDVTRWRAGGVLSRRIVAAENYDVRIGFGGEVSNRWVDYGITRRDGTELTGSSNAGRFSFTLRLQSIFTTD